MGTRSRIEGLNVVVRRRCHRCRTMKSPSNPAGPWRQTGGVVGKMVRGKQGAWCRSKDPQPSEARRSGSRKANLWAVALNCILKRHRLGRGLRPMWKAALSDVRCHWVLVSRRRSLSCARNHLTDPGPRFGMLANVSSVVSRRSPIVFSPANFTAFRIRVGKRTISTRVSFGRSGPRSNILQPIHLAFFSPSSTSRRIWSARVR